MYSHRPRGRHAIPSIHSTIPCLTTTACAAQPAGLQLQSARARSIVTRPGDHHQPHPLAVAPILLTSGRHKTLGLPLGRLAATVDSSAGTCSAPSEAASSLGERRLPQLSPKRWPSAWGSLIVNAAQTPFSANPVSPLAEARPNRR
jgi:hypothetical protein